MLAPAAGGGGCSAAPGARAGRLVVVDEPALEEGASASSTRSRSRSAAARERHPARRRRFASARHARIEPRRDGVWVADVGSTNGTYVNGARLTRARRLAPGDVLRVGGTDLRYER